MNLPDAKHLYRVVEGTWPPVEIVKSGGVTLRRGAGGGSRVSSATVDAVPSDLELKEAEAQMRAWNQQPLFMIRQQDEAIDAHLSKRGYVIKDPVALYAAPIAEVAQERPPPVTSFAVWPPLAAQSEIWANGGIGAARLDVMERAPMPKTTLFGRLLDRPAGTVFVGIAEGCAMIHALEVAPDFRKQGLARWLTIAAAFWGKAQGASYLTLVTTTDNTASNALYASLGMTVVGRYHYRIHPEG